MSHIDDRITRLSASLAQAVVLHDCYHDCVHVQIPGGLLEVKFWEDGAESIQLLEGDFHTHLEILSLEQKMGEEQAFASFVRQVLDGRLPVIRETSPEGVTRITIEPSLDEYLRYLPTGATYRVLNAT